MENNQKSGFLPILLQALLVFAASCTARDCSSTKTAETPNPVRHVHRLEEGVVHSIQIAPGDRIITLRGGIIEVTALSSTDVTFARKKSFVLRKNGRYHIGNHEYLEIKSIELDKNQATIEVFSRELIPVLDALSF